MMQDGSLFHLSAILRVLSKLYLQSSWTNHQVDTSWFIPQTIFFSSYPIWFLNLFKFKPVSRYRTFFPTLLITSTDFSDFYIEPFDSNVIGHFCCWLNFCCITFLCTSPGFHSRTGKLQVQEPTFPILEHCSCHARWSLTFVITDEPIKQPM